MIASTLRNLDTMTEVPLDEHVSSDIFEGVDTPYRYHPQIEMVNVIFDQDLAEHDIQNYNDNHVFVTFHPYEQTLNGVKRRFHLPSNTAPDFNDEHTATRQALAERNREIGNSIAARRLLEIQLPSLLANGKNSKKKMLTSFLGQHQLLITYAA
jgi:hypothetical protein